MGVVWGPVGATFLVYLCAMLVIGAIAFRRTQAMSDYILGGRGLNRWVAALSAQASDMSGWLLLGLPGFAYASGLNAVWLAGGLLLGIYLNWRLVAAPLRQATLDYGNCLTLPDFFAARFRDSGRTLRIVSAFFILFFFLFYSASALVAGGKLFNEVFGFPYLSAVALGAVVVVAYTFLGGFLAVAWTDVVQGTMMFVALVIVPGVAIMELGGMNASVAAIVQVDAALMDPTIGRDGESVGVIGLVSLAAWGLGYFGQPHILARFMATRSRSEVAAARRIAVIWSLVTMAGAVLVGLAGIGILDPPLTGAETETVFIRLVDLLFHPLVAGLWLAAILAAIMSTADSQLLVSASAVAEDIYKGLLRPRATERETVWIGRLAVVAIAVTALAIALEPDRRVLDLVAYAWAGLGAAFGPAILLALYWSGGTGAGTLAGIVTGALTVIVWKQLEGGLFALYELVPGFLLAALANVIISRMYTPSDKRQW